MLSSYKKIILIIINNTKLSGVYYEEKEVWYSLILIFSFFMSLFLNLLM